jgi:hypothetical protein
MICDGICSIGNIEGGSMGLIEFMHLHPFLTFLLAYLLTDCLVGLVKAFRK